jgi:magnesium transporter
VPGPATSGLAASIVAAVLRVLDLPSGGAPVLHLDEHAIGPPPERTTRWIDITEPTPALMERLRERLGFDTLSLTDCLERGTQSKLVEHERYQFIVLHAFTKDPDDPLAIVVHEIHAFLGERLLVTVHDSPVPAQDQVFARAERDPSVLTRGADWALYLSAEAMVAAAEPLVTDLRAELDELDRAIIEDEADIDLKVPFRIKRVALAMRRVLRPLRDTLSILGRRTDDVLTPRTRAYIRDLGDHVIRLTELVEETREVALGVVAGFQALQASKVNTVMKRLTVFSAVFLPLSFIVGFWGQNFTGLPYDSGLWLGLMLISIVAVPLGLLEWFRRNWL